VTGGAAEALGYYNNDLVDTLTQSGVTQTWNLDPADRQSSMSQSGSSIATVNHYSDFDGDSPTWSVLTSASGISATSVNDDDLAGGLAATTSDTSGSTAITYQLTDTQGNVIGTADPSSSSEIVTPLVTDDFGDEQTISGAAATGPRYGWLGGDQRDGAGLGGIVLMGVRGYAPTLGRFLSTDAVLEGSASPYDYCGQDPINNSDLDGLAFHPSAHVRDVWGFLVGEYNYTPTEAAAILGNLMQESSEDLHIHELTGQYHGIAQWGTSGSAGRRWQAEGRWCDHHDRFKLSNQVGFIDFELHNSHSSALRDMRADGNDLYTATEDCARYYEGAVNPDGSIQQLRARENFATDVYTYFHR
jgi:RHS repeat-associated protein